MRVQWSVEFALEERAEKTDAGVVDQHIGQAGLGGDVIGKLTHCGFVRNVDHEGPTANVEALDLALGLRERLGVDIGQHDVRAALRKRFRDAFADTRGAARDQHELAAHVFHLAHAARPRRLAFLGAL